MLAATADYVKAQVVCGKCVDVSGSMVWNAEETSVDVNKGIAFPAKTNESGNFQRVLTVVVIVPFCRRGDVGVCP